MTVRDVFAVALRRWYLMLLGALLSLGALYQATHVPPLYYTQYFVVLLAPQTTTFPNTLEDPSFGMAPMAGLIVSDYTEGHREPILGSPDTLLHGEGVREGSRVRLLNDGSQWQPLYGRPNIDVQVVGPDPDRVVAEAKRIGMDLMALIEKRQADLSIAETNRITAVTSPPDPVIVGAGGSRSRAVLAVAAAGAIGTTVCVVQCDRWLVHRRGLRGRRRGPHPQEPARTPVP